MAKNAVRGAVNAATTQRTPRPPAPPQREEREIESWLGELRGGPGGTGGQPPRPPQPAEGNEPTTAIPVQRPGQDPTPNQSQPDAGEATTKIPTPEKSTPPSDPESTEKIDLRDDAQKRRGGGVSAQDLLRREGRI
jgi:RND superfamily putative drug exporter